MNPLEVAMHWLDKDANVVDTITYSDMLARIRTIARYIAEDSKIKRGDRVILCYPPGLEFFYGF